MCQVTKKLGGGIVMLQVGINECHSEVCRLSEGSDGCSSVLVVETAPTLVNSNSSSMVGVTTKVVHECVCAARNYTHNMDTYSKECFNGGMSRQTPNGFRCDCPTGYLGPRCQQTSRTFLDGRGWAWFPALKQCKESHISFHFLTWTASGLLLYNGPLRSPLPGEHMSPDYLSVQLVRGKLRVEVDHGTGPAIISITHSNKLNNGKWHRVDIFTSGKDVRVMLDNCREVEMSESGYYDRSQCEGRNRTLGRNSFLNVHTPLILGGVGPVPAPRVRIRGGIDGCIRDLTQDGEVYDLGNPGRAKFSRPGCQATDKFCLSEHSESRCVHGTCTAGHSNTNCECQPGWRGHYCDKETEVRDFKPGSYIRYQFLSLPLYTNYTKIQVRFRTIRANGTLLYVSGLGKRVNNYEFMALEIRAHYLRYRYNLGEGNHELWLDKANVTDGQWHTVVVERFGSDVFIILDGGGVAHYNVSMGQPHQHRLMNIDKEEVYVGAQVEIASLMPGKDSPDMKEVYEILPKMSDFEGCMTDIRYNGHLLPMDVHRANRYAAVFYMNHVTPGCYDLNGCLGRDRPACSGELECRDFWRHTSCRCRDGYAMLTPETGKINCIDINECQKVTNPCLNGGVCDNEIGTYRCSCPEGWEGANCERTKQETYLNVGDGAIVAILLCFLCLLIVVLAFVFWSRRRKSGKKYPYEVNEDDDIRENIISYNDEGGGEDDQDAYDISRLRKPIDTDANGHATAGNGMVRPVPTSVPTVAIQPDVMRKRAVIAPSGEAADVGVFLDGRLRVADGDLSSPPYDDLRAYAYEGGGSTAGSLSSLASGTDDEDQDFRHLSEWGPRFHKLAEMYGGSRGVYGHARPPDL